MKLRVHPATRPLQGRVRAPGDKSISHRLAIFSAMAEGESRIEGYLDSADTQATLQAVVQLGAGLRQAQGALFIRGGAWRAPEAPLDLGNSGTGMRLLAGALAGHPSLRGQRVVLIGDASLSGRPMARIIDPLSAMGAMVESQDGHAPLVITPQSLQGQSHALPMASAQVKSAILLAALHATGDTRITAPGISRDHSERLLPAFGVALSCSDSEILLHGPQRLEACDATVPGDLSSAAFMLAAGILVPGSAVGVDRVGLNPTRDGWLRIMASMGAAIEQTPLASLGLEPVGQLTAQHCALTGVRVPEPWVPLAIDEFPLLMAMAACAEGPTRIEGAAELRVKESDRLAMMSSQLRRLGVTVDEFADGACVMGGTIQGGEVSSGGDHRIAMSLAVLALVAKAPVVIDGAEWISTSYPRFVEDLRSLGATLEWL